MPKLPTFTNEQEAADWFATHDTAPYMEDMEEVQEPIPVVRSHFGEKYVSIRSDYLGAVKHVAEKMGIPYQALIQLWLVEKLRQEAPELLKQ